MYQLTKEQKISNVKELIESKRRKMRNLSREIQDLEKKLQRLQGSSCSPVNDSQDQGSSGKTSIFS